ncbi:MAG: phosphatase PAP2 family protein [Archangium sp.]
MQRVVNWDVRISKALEARRRHRVITWVCIALSWSGAGGVWAALAISLFALLQFEVTVMPRQLGFLRAMTTALVALIIGSVLKRVVKRSRPFASTHGISRGIWAPGEHHSFPSTHAATSVALAVALLIIGHPLAWPVSAWAAGVVFSRVWLGVHFPSDVAAGSLLGIACAPLVLLIR